MFAENMRENLNNNKTAVAKFEMNTEKDSSD